MQHKQQLLNILLWVCAWVKKSCYGCFWFDAELWVLSLPLEFEHFFPKMAVFHIEMLIVSNFSGIPICSVDTYFCFLFQWLWATLWRKVRVIFYYLTFNPCVKGFTNVLGEISEIFAVNFLKVHPLSVFPSCNSPSRGYPARCTFWVHWEMPCLVTVWAEHGRALILWLFRKSSVCLCTPTRLFSLSQFQSWFYKPNRKY